MSGAQMFSDLVDACISASRIVHLQDERAGLLREVSQLGTRCGDCDKWMKSHYCPKEKNVNGYSRGPSMNDFKCTEFVERQVVDVWRQEKKTRIAEIESALSPKPEAPR